MALKRFRFKTLEGPVQAADLKTMSLKQLPKPGVETAAALIGTAFSAMLLVLTAMNAGPLWRDEINTLNMAQMPSLKDTLEQPAVRIFSTALAAAAARMWFSRPDGQ